ESIARGSIFPAFASPYACPVTSQRLPPRDPLPIDRCSLLCSIGMVTFGCTLVGSLFYSPGNALPSCAGLPPHGEVDHEKPVLDCRPVPCRTTGQCRIASGPVSIRGSPGYRQGRLAGRSG